MSAAAIIQINCRPAPDLQVGDRLIQGLFIAPDDAAWLQAAKGAEAVVRLACPGRGTCHARLSRLAERMVPVPNSDDWYISVTATGRLYTKDR